MSRFFASILATAARRFSLAGAFALFGLFVFGKFSAEIHRSNRLAFVDHAVLHLFRTHSFGPLHALMRGVTWIAGPIPQACVLLAAILFFARRGQIFPQGAMMALAGIGGVGVVSGVKALFHRPRPDLIFAPLGYSFPSGHSFFAVVVYGTIAHGIAENLPRGSRKRRLVWATAIAAMLLVGFSRIYLGEHFPSDVGAGYAAAIPWLWACATVMSRFKRTPNDARG